MTSMRFPRGSVALLTIAAALGDLPPGNVDRSRGEKAPEDMRAARRADKTRQAPAKRAAAEAKRRRKAERNRKLRDG